MNRAQKAIDLPAGTDFVVRMPTVCKATGYAAQTVYIKMQRGEFPKPDVMLGVRARGWWWSTIAAYLEGLKAKGPPTAPHPAALLPHDKRGRPRTARSESAPKRSRGRPRRESREVADVV
jgi:predicted DNA-binding transcriptional regulator AlpA